MRHTFRKERLLVVVMVFVFCLFATVAHAKGARIALVNADPELEHSVSVALSPWGIVILKVEADPLGAAFPEASQSALEVARRFEVDAVAWLAATRSQSTLFVYDVQTDDVQKRTFSGAPPFTSADAAAVALSLKTLLRTTDVAPVSERLPRQEPTPIPDREHLRLELDGNARVIPVSTLEPRLGLGAVYWLDAPPTRFGISLSVSAGAGVNIDTASFSGRARDLSFASSLRFQIAGSERVTFALLGGAGGHLTSLEGSVSQGGSVDKQRFNVSLDAGALLDFKVVEMLWFGIGLKSSYRTGHQRYLVNNEPIFENGPFAFEAGGRVGVALF